MSYRNIYKPDQTQVKHKDKYAKRHKSHCQKQNQTKEAETR